MLLATLTLLLIASSPQETRPAVPWPTQGWKASTPAAEGVDAAVLESLDAEIRAGDLGLVDSMLVIRHGQVVFDRERLAIHLYYLEADPVNAAMSALGLSRSGYYKLLSRARENLAGLLGPKDTSASKT